jgi:hypothetical protein
MKSKSLIFILSLFFSVSLFGQAKFYASLNTKSIPLNQNFQLNFTLENANGQNLRLPNLGDFQVLSGPNTSQSMQWVNGTTTQSVTYSYILRPTKEGTFKIGKASIAVGGVNMESNEVQISVTAPVQQNAQQQQRRSPNPFSFDPFEDPFAAMDEVEEPAVSSADLEKQIRENVFLKMTTSQNEVYVGEHIVATLKLYYRLNFGNVQMTKSPKFDGFWSQEIPIVQNQKPKVENINGQQFYVLEVQKYNLYPQRIGSLQVSPAELNMIVQVQSQKRRDVWSLFSGGGVQNLNYKPTSNIAKIRVKEPPTANQPKGYNGAVGQFSFETKLSSKEAKTDEAITLTVKVSGSGNLNTIEIPKPELPEEFEVFDPKTKEDMRNGVSGYKQYDYLIIPRQPGNYKIEPIAFSYFDPNKEKYFTIQSPEYSLNVTGAPSQNVVQNNTSVTEKSNAEAVKNLGKDIRYIHTDESALETTSNFVSSPLHYGLMISPIFLFLGLIAVKRNSDEDAKDIAGSKLRRAKKMAKKRLTNAEQHLNANAPKLFYDEISRAVLGYLSDKLLIAAADLSKENIGEKLASKNVSTALVEEIRQLLENCEFALYTNQTSPANMEQQYQNAIKLISSLEDVLQK